MTASGCRRPVLGMLALAVSPFFLNTMMANEAAAIGMEVTPSVRIEEGWYSNVLNASDNAVSSPGTRLAPALALRFITGEDSSFQLFGSYSRTWYSDSDARGAEYNTVYFRLDSPEGVRFSPNWTLNPSVYYVNTTDSYSRVQLLPSGDPVLPPVTITNYGNTRTDDFGGAAVLNYQATPTLKFGLNGSYAILGFSGSDSSTRYGGVATVSYLYTPRTTLGVVAAGNHQTYPTLPDSSTLSGGVQFGYLFSPALRSDLTIGMSYIRQTIGSVESNESSPSGLFRVTYTSETFTGSLYGSALYSGYGYGEPRRQGTVGMYLRDQFSTDWSWNLSGAYQVSQAVFGSTSGYLHTMYGSAGLGFRPWEWGGLDLTGNLYHQTSGDSSGSDLDRYSVVLSLTIGKTYTAF